MSTDPRDIIIIRRTQLNTRELRMATVQRLRAIQTQAESGASLTVAQKAYVAWAAFRCASR